MTLDDDIERLRSKRLLLVDDEEVLLRVMMRQFRRRGIPCEGAHSGNEALERLKEGEFDVVVSDVRMADGDAIALLKGIRARGDQLDVIVLVSGFTDYSNADFAALGVSAVLAKPLRATDLITAIAQKLPAVYA